MCTLQNHVEKVCTLVSLYHVYFKFVYSVMAPYVKHSNNLNLFRAKLLTHATSKIKNPDIVNSSRTGIVFFAAQACCQPNHGR